MPHVLISAGHKSSGKTTITLGLCAALHRRGLNIQPFKKGPDYIDPMWLTLAANKDCHNLDFHSMTRDEIRGTFRQYGHDSDLSLIEGNKGLYDGLDLEGRNSNAALARMIKAPVVLVIDAQGMTRGIAPLILGYQAFDKRVNIAGIILNKLGGKRHEGKLRAVIEHYTNVPVIGAVHRNDALRIPEQHLGLTPGSASAETLKQIEVIADLVEAQVDLDKFISIASTSPAIKAAPGLTLTTQRKSVRIGVARDKAFGFYYPGDLSALKAAGAEIVEINTFKDTQLPEIDGLFIGGGFPESYLQELSTNTGLMRDIAREIEAGMPVYAECGGLMYLTRSIKWDNRSHLMVGAIPADTEMCDKPQGRGYVRLKETNNMPWLPENTNDNNKEFCAHEFHYSRLINVNDKIKYAYKVMRGFGIDGENDGVVYKNVLASYTHLRNVKHNKWASRFVEFVNNCKHKQIPAIKVAKLN
ncbi:MAG: hydrogenobyrinic acid a,c-diamide synthase (glutamine-hydrolyzing) [Gammaproteobacteria bacterium]|nr:hydrogenobyrinic acid a,c-diamide synthase (glutamine-hydrolyzing) [Gammaproteobacteria bacterium]